MWKSYCCYWRRTSIICSCQTLESSKYIYIFICHNHAYFTAHFYSHSMLLFQAVGELGQLINTSSSNLTYHASNIGNVMDILKNTTDAAEKTYDAKFGDYRPCVHAAVDIFNMYFNTLVSGLFASFVVIFLLSFLIRETFFTYFVKKEFTEAGWKKEAYFNKVMTCIWTIVGVYFLYYLYSVAENGNSARHGRVVSYFSTH